VGRETIGHAVCDRQHVGKGAVHVLVEPAEEVDGLEVLAATEAVRNPLAVFA
jgi:hypothetical protein